jgi:hypothetical protein
VILTDSDRAAVALYPELRRLIILRQDRRWHFVPNYRLGDVELLVGARVWRPEGWSDAIAIADHDDARAFRCDPAGGEVWGREGGFAEVIDSLIELPAPDEPDAPRLVRGPARRLWVPDAGSWTRMPSA